MSRWREKGASNIGCILALIVLGALIIVGIKVVPVRIAVAELQDFCEKEADTAYQPRNTDEKLTESIFRKAMEEQLPVNKENIKVWRDTGQIHIEIKYHVPLDLLVTTYDWNVEHKVDRVLF